MGFSAKPHPPPFPTPDLVVSHDAPGCQEQGGYGQEDGGFAGFSGHEGHSTIFPGIYLDLWGSELSDLNSYLQYLCAISLPHRLVGVGGKVGIYIKCMFGFRFDIRYCARWKQLP